jgi:hypothetical protein
MKYNAGFVKCDIGRGVYVQFIDKSNGVAIDSLMFYIIDGSGLS